MINRSSKKKAMQSLKKRFYNSKNKSMIRTLLKKVRNFVDAKDKNSAKATLCIAQSVLDRQTSKGLIHKNKAARLKSNLYKRIDSI